MIVDIKKFFKRFTLNFPLLIGSVIILILTLMSIYPEYFSPADPYGVQRMQYNSEGKTATEKVILPPIPPGKDYPWGTDERGRDMKSLVVYGAKTTIIVAAMAAFFRLLIALPLAISAAYNNKLAAWLIKQFKILFSAMPLIIAVFILSKIALFNDIIKNPAISSAIWVILLGWSSMAHQLKQKITEILQQDFIEGEIAIGKSKWEIAMQNILPHLIPTMVVLFFLEIAMILLFMSQIGVLGVSFGGGYYTVDGDLSIANEFDWASLLQFSYLLFGTNKMWMVLYPAIAFAVSIIGFNLFAEGLRLEFDKRDSRVITTLRKLPSLFSPKDLIYEISNYKLFKPIIIKKLTIYLVIITIVFFPALPSRYKIDADNAMSVISELTKDSYGGRQTGTEGMKRASDYVAGKLKEYGVQPLGEGYIQNFKVKQTSNIKYADLKVQTSDGQQIEFEHRKNFTIYTPNDIKEKMGIVPMDAADIERITYQGKVTGYRDKIILFNTIGLDSKTITSTLMRMSFILRPRCVMFIDSWESSDNYAKTKYVDKGFENTTVISISKDKGDELLRHKDVTIELEVHADKYNDTTGYNVLGVIPGSNPALADQCIVIGSSLDYLGNDEQKNYPGALEAGAVGLELEIARSLIKNGIKPEKTIIFGFWDATYTDDRGSGKFVNSSLTSKYKNLYYVDLKYFANKHSTKLLLDTSKSIPKSKLSQAYIKGFKSTARAKNITVQYARLNSFVLQDFLGLGREALLFSSDGIDDYISSPEDKYENISRKKLYEYGQIVFDTIVKMSKQKI